MAKAYTMWQKPTLGHLCHTSVTCVAYHLRATSVHGMLWLQTHFESNHWESISSGLVIIPTNDAKMLANDAKMSGLNINFINSLSQIDKI